MKHITCGETGLGIATFIYKAYLISVFFDLDYTNAMSYTRKRKS